MEVHHTPESVARLDTEYFIGEVRIQPIIERAEGSIGITLVRFSPGSRTYLHTHHVPQILHCVSGRGILATKDNRNIVGPGDIVHVPAGEEHWHGAPQDSSFVHLSIRPPGPTDWTQIDPLDLGDD
ncbi:MAG TPA: cupin domain-containing protein [Dehalococcoidia bacterium]|nr:cupin domain-containing protein [Dehalococcoidia bacterium]